jgi:hypothetical protein
MPSCVYRLILLSAPGAEIDPDIMGLAATGTALAQDTFAVWTNQPTRNNFRRATGALTSQRSFGRRWFIELHADEVKNYRKADDEKQKHTASHRL